MRKYLPIEIGSKVYWNIKVKPELDYIAPVDATVVSFPADSMAEIVVHKSRVTNAEKVHYIVPLSELENKSYSFDYTAATQRNFDKAEKVTDLTGYEGGFYDPEDNDDFYWGIEDYLEHCEINEIEPSKFLFLSKPITDIVHYDADDFAERLNETLHEDYEPKNLDALQTAIDEFYKANSDHGYFEIDYSRVYLLEQ